MYGGTPLILLTMNNIINELAAKYGGYTAGEYCVIEKVVPNKGLIIYRITMEEDKPIIDVKRYLPNEVPETQEAFDEFEKLATDFVKELSLFFQEKTGENYEISHDWIEKKK